jgi:hypothetical protein
MKLSYIKNPALATLTYIGLTLMPLTIVSKAENSPSSTGTLNEEVKMTVIINGSPKGSVTLPAGREVTILEEKDGKLKVSDKGLSTAWVDEKSVSINENINQEQPKQPVSSHLVGKEGGSTEISNSEPSSLPNTGDETSQNTQTQNSHIAKGAPTLTIKSSESEEEIDFTGRPCKGKTVTTKIQTVISNHDSEDSSNIRVKVFGVLANNNDGKPYKLNGRILPEIELKELQPLNQSDGQTYEYSHRVFRCRCCRDIERRTLKGVYSELEIDGQTVYTNKDQLNRKEKEAVEEYLNSKGS